MWVEIWFQIAGPQTEKARFPNWVRVLTTTAALVVEERSCNSVVVRHVISLRLVAQQVHQKSK